DDLAKIPGVVDTQGLTTIKDVVAEADGIRMERLFPRTDLPQAELASGRRTATTDPLFAWNLAPPDGHATIVQITLAKEHASKEATRTQFLRNARAVLKKHEREGQKLILNGLPVIRSEFTELITSDFNLLFPIALVVILLLLYLTFRSASDVA